MDFDNVAELVKGMQEYLESHDIRKAGLLEYDAFEVNGDQDPRLKALTDKDRYGEYLGRYYHSSVTSPDDPHVSSKITVYLDSDDRPMGVWNNIGGFVDNYEIFEHHDGYFTGACYMVMGGHVTPSHFTYYVQEGGRVVQMHSLPGTSMDVGTVIVSRFEFGYEGDTTILKTAFNYINDLKEDGTYELRRKDDLLLPPKSAKKIGGKGRKRVDNQEKLASMLNEKVNDQMTLAELVDAFFEVVSKAKPVDDEMLQYAAGDYPKDLGPFTPPCSFILMRQTPNGDEFFQLNLEVGFDIPEGEKIPYDFHCYEDGDEDLKEFVLNSKSFNALKDKAVSYVQVYVDET